MHRYDSCRRPPAESRLSRPAGPPAEPPSACGAKEQEHRLKVLFQVLDVNGDGGICVNDLTIGLKKLGVHRTEHELLVSEDATVAHSSRHGISAASIQRCTSVNTSLNIQPGSCLLQAGGPQR